MKSAYFQRSIMGFWWFKR